MAAPPVEGDMAKKRVKRKRKAPAQQAKAIRGAPENK